MRRLALLLGLLFATPTFAAIALVQTPGTFATANAASVSQAYGSNNTAGNLLVAMFHQNTGGSGVSSVTDTQGNTWYQFGLSNLGISTIFYCPSAKAGANIVTGNFSTSGNIGISVAEYSGQYAAHPAATSVTNAQTLSPSMTIPVPVSGSLVIALWGDNSQAFTYSGFTNCTNQSTAVGPSVWCDNTNASAGPLTVSCTQTGSGSPDHISLVVSFLPASYTPPVTPALLTQFSGGSQSNGALQGTGASPRTGFFPGGNQRGNTIVIAVAETNTSSTHVTGVTDTDGNSYTLQAGGAHVLGSLNNWVSFWTAPVKKTTFTINTVTLTLSSGSAGIGGMEFSGATIVQDSNANSDSQNTNTPSYTLTAAAANELIVTCNISSSGGINYSALSGTDIFGVTNIVQEVNWLLSASGSNSIHATSSANGNGGVSIALLQGMNPLPSGGGRAVIF